MYIQFSLTYHCMSLVIYGMHHEIVYTTILSETKLVSFKRKQ
jgi:hypothetical protein